MTPVELVAAELQHVTAAMTGQPEWLELSHLVVGADGAKASEALKLLSAAFSYDLINPRHTDRRVTAGGPFASRFGAGESAVPPHPANVEPEVLAFWERANEQLDHPIAAARLRDLVYTAKGRSAHADGRAASAALAELSGLKQWSEMLRATCLARAVEISLELADKEVRVALATRAASIIDEFSRLDYPGPALTAVGAAASLKPKDRPDDFEALLARLVERYVGTEHADAALSAAIDSTADAPRRVVLKQRRLAAQVEEANAQTGLRRGIGIQRAIALAKEYGLSDEATALTRQLQEMSTDDLEFETFEASVDVPTAAIEREIDFFVGSHAANAIDGLGRIGAQPPPGGSNEDIDREVRQMNPILSLLGGQQLFSGGSAIPRYVAASPEEKALFARGRAREQNAAFHGDLLIAPMLVQVIERHPRPTHDELVDHFDTNIIGRERADRMARAVELYWDGHYDDSAHVLVPRLESILRDIAETLGVLVEKIPQAGRYGGVIPLGTVMRKLREFEPSEPWLDYLEALLCEPTAMNLRNNISHGLVNHVGQRDAALLIQAGCHLALMRKATAEDEPAVQN